MGVTVKGLLGKPERTREKHARSGVQIASDLFIFEI